MKLCALLLAAGESKRFRGPSKLTVPFQNGASLLEKQIALLTGLNIEEKVICLNPVTEAAAKPFLARTSGISTVVNPSPGRGLHSSIREGINSSSTDTLGWILWLADLPQLSEIHFAKLIEEIHETKGQLLLAPSYQGTRGHPVFIPAKYRGRILAEPDSDHGCRYLWCENPHEAQKDLQWEDPAVLADFDS